MEAQSKCQGFSAISMIVGLSSDAHIFMTHLQHDKTFYTSLITGKVRVMPSFHLGV